MPSRDCLTRELPLVARLQVDKCASPQISHVGVSCARAEMHRARVQCARARAEADREARFSYRRTGALCYCSAAGLRAGRVAGTESTV